MYLSGMSTGHSRRDVEWVLVYMSVQFRGEVKVEDVKMYVCEPTAYR